MGPAGWISARPRVLGLQTISLLSQYVSFYVNALDRCVSIRLGSSGQTTKKAALRPPFHWQCQYSRHLALPAPFCEAEGEQSQTHQCQCRRLWNRTDPGLNVKVARCGFGSIDSAPDLHCVD